MQVTINQAQSNFVLTSGSGVSCLGFQTVFTRLTEICARLAKAGKPTANPLINDVGTMIQYEQYCASMASYSVLGDTRTWYEENTYKKVRTIIENYRETRERIRVFYGDPESGLDLMEEFDTIGTIGRSSGIFKVPLLLTNAADGGGSVLNSSRIVKLVDVNSGAELFCVKNYHVSELTIGDSGCWEDTTCTHGVWSSEGEDLKNVANFHSYAKAAHFIAFITGETNDFCH